MKSKVYAKTLVSLSLVLAVLLLFPMSFAEGIDTFKVGLIGPMTGDAATYGNAVANGARIAVAEVNALGGIQLELNVQDDEHDAEKSVNAYNTLMDQGAQLIIGTVTTTPCIAVGTEAYNDRVFMLTPTASSPDVIKEKDNIYQICFTDPAQGAASAEYIFNKKLATKVGVIYNNADAYSTGIYQTFETKAKELGLELVNVSTFTGETTDFSVQLSSAKSAGAELVFLPVYYTPASMIFQQAAAMEYKPVFFGVDGMDGILSIEGFDKSLADGVLLLTPFSADAADERTQSFVQKYKELANDIPNQFAADAYDAVYVIYQAATAGKLTPSMSHEEVCEAMIAEMQKLTYDGITGTMSWQATGEVTKTPTAVVIKDGAYVSAE